MKNILVSINLNEFADVIIDQALEMVSKESSKIWVLHVAEPEPEFVGYGPGPQYVRDARANELKKEHKVIQEHIDRITKQGYQADGLIHVGAIVDSIMKESEKLNTDLIVVGHEEHNLFFRGLFGSTSNSLMHNTRVPVLIVPCEDESYKEIL